MKVLIATEKPFAKVAVEGMKKEIQKAELEVVLLEKYSDKAELLKAVQDVQAIIIRSDIIDKEVLDVAKDLKLVVRAGAGYDNIDLDVATAKGVCVMNTPGQNSNAVAELVFGLLVMAIRNNFNGTSGCELKGKKLGIHACGHVGKNVVRIAKGFDLEIYAFDPYANEEEMKKEGVIMLPTVEKLYETCNFISLHLPFTCETGKSISADLMRKMPENGILINTARKEVIDEEGLISILKERKDLKYYTDIKPSASAQFNELFAAEGRYFETPKKMGAQTAEANIYAGIAAAKQTVEYLKEGIARFQVNKC